MIAAETWKSATLGETIVGIKTVKALALEPQRRALWDERIAEAGKWRLAFARLANWPQTLVDADRALDGARHDDDRRLSWR